MVGHKSWMFYHIQAISFLHPYYGDFYDDYIGKLGLRKKG